jgi:hypothetical protein
MKQETATDLATALLKHLIEHQPTLLRAASTPHSDDGKNVAEFCATFIDTYADHLMKSNAKTDD